MATVEYNDRKGRKRKDAMSGMLVKLDAADTIRLDLGHGKTVTIMVDRDIVEIAGSDLFARQTGQDSVTIRS
jgi:hypothetical protein